MPEAQTLLELYDAVARRRTDEARARRSGTQMLTIYADQVFSIGTVAGVPQPVVVSNSLHNVPEDGIYNWDPGAHLRHLQAGHVLAVATTAGRRP